MGGPAGASIFETSVGCAARGARLRVSPAVASTAGIGRCKASENSQTCACRAGHRRTGDRRARFERQRPDRTWRDDPVLPGTCVLRPQRTAVVLVLPVPVFLAPDGADAPIRPGARSATTPRLRPGARSASPPLTPARRWGGLRPTPASRGCSRAPLRRPAAPRPHPQREERVDDSVSRRCFAGLDLAFGGQPVERRLMAPRLW